VWADPPEGTASELAAAESESNTTEALPTTSSTPPRVGRKIVDFSLRDVYGKTHRLSDYAQSPVIVVMFLGTECPLAKLYAPRLAALTEKYAEQGVAFVAIASNTQDSIAELHHFMTQHALTFPVLKDPAQAVADMFGATRTPEVFVLDGDRTVRYAGRIDDQYGIGYQRPEPEREYLSEAIAAVVSGQAVTESENDPIGCIIGRAKEPAQDGEITYASHIADILNRRCVECHRNDQIAPFPLATYDDLNGWGDMILEVVDEGRMPPWHANPEFGHFRNDARLTDTEKQNLRTWINAGMPQGDPTYAPTPPKYAEGWRIPEPDQVYYMSDNAFDVPAEGVVDYQYFEVDPGFTEDKYIWAAEARPDNVSVVHHIIVYIKTPGQEDLHTGGMVAGYAPGSLPRILDDGMAIRVPAGSKLLFEMHYTPNGSAAKDRSHLGVKFLDANQVRKLVFGNLAIDQDFVIPPHAGDHVVTAEREIKRDLKLLNLTPHMHLRGKSFRYEAIYPDGTTEVLLDVPKYDFNWQLSYELQEPKLLPKGTRIHCTAVFDNSEENLANPNPGTEVRWGEQSWNEMMIGFFDVTTAD
jgi:peroxiredoxin